MPKWEKGQSGNPLGRKPKGRTLTDILEKVGNQKRYIGLEPVAQKQLLANLLWQAATTGQVTFPDGTIRTLDIQDWNSIVKFIYQHIDGPPKSEIEIAGKDGGAIEHRIDHGIDGDTATNIFDILAAAGAFQPGADDAKDDQVHTPHANA